MSPLRRRAENHCQVFCINISGALSSLIYIKILNLIIILNFGIRRYLITNKTIITSNKTSVRHLNVINFMGELLMRVEFCVCLWLLSIWFNSYSKNLILLIFIFVCYYSNIKGGEYMDNNQLMGIHHPIYMKYQHLLHKSYQCEFINALFLVKKLWCNMTPYSISIERMHCWSNLKVQLYLNGYQCTAPEVFLVQFWWI